MSGKTTKRVQIYLDNILDKGDVIPSYEEVPIASLDGEELKREDSVQIDGRFLPMSGDGSLKPINGVKQKVTRFIIPGISLCMNCPECLNASRMTSESRDAMYRRAMSLLSARCSSVAPSGPTDGITKPIAPQYYYIKQETPRPMPPLKAWNGYNGNVYFEPIHITTVNDSADSASCLLRASDNAMLVNRKRAASERADRQDSSTTRTASRQTSKSIKSGLKPVLFSDKGSVLNPLNQELEQDLDFFEGLDCTGSLGVSKLRPRPQSDITMEKEQRRALMYNRERICKGSVVHKVNLQGSRNPRSHLKVNGGKFIPAAELSPLLRTQTQYSHSNQRLTTNSPDPFHHQLPPLEQFRATVRHMDVAESANKARYNKRVTGEVKPFIKYSPAVKTTKQATYV